MDYLLRQERLFERSQLDTIFPVKSYDPESKMFWVAGDEKRSFLAASWLCVPLSGVDHQASMNLKAILSNDYPTDTIISFHLTSTTFIDPVLTRFYNARAQVMSDKTNRERAALARRFVDNRIRLYRQGAKEALDMDNPMLLKDFSLVTCMKVPCSKVPTEEEFERIRTLSVSFESALSSLRCAPMAMNHEDYIMVMRAMLNPTKYPKTQLDPNRELNEQIFDFDDSIEVASKYLKVNDRYVRSLSVQRFPEVSLLPQVSYLIGDPKGSINQIAEPFILSTHVYIPDFQKKREEIKATGGKLRTQAMGRFGAMFPRIRLKNENYQILIDSIEEGNRPVQIWTNLLLSSDNLDSLNKQTTRVKSFYEFNNYLLKDDLFTQGPCWQQQFPMAITPEAVKRSFKFSTMSSEHACELIPIIGDWKGNGVGANNLFYTKRGQPVMYDPWDSDTSFNGIVTGISGGGKSVLCNDLLMGAYTRGAIIRIIDSGYSYRKVTSTVGGEFIDFGEDSNIIVNPFTNIADINEEYNGIETILEFMAAPKDGLSDYQRSQMQKYVLECWAKHGNKLDITTLSEHIVRDATSRRDQDCIRLGHQFFPYTRHGANGRYFDGDANLSFTKDWSCLELDGLQNKPDLRMIVLIMMVMKLKQDFISTDRSRRGILLIDEFWKFLLVSGNAEKDIGTQKVMAFINESFRVFRKFSKACFVATQALSDLGVGSPLISNAETIILTKQRRESINFMKNNQMLSISDYDYEMLKTLDRVGSKYSEIFIYTTNRGSGFLRFKLDRATQLLYTSNAQEDTRIRFYEAQGMTVLEAIDAYIQELDQEQNKKAG